MESNNDELFSDMLRSIDRHADSIRRQQKQLEKHNRVLDKHTVELTRQSRRNEEFFKDLKIWMRDQEAVQNNHLELIVRTANRLDILIKKNKLRT